MKRLLLFVMPLMLLMLSACIGAFYIPGEDDETSAASETQAIASVSLDGSIQPGEAQEEQEITLTFDFGERTGVYSGEMKDGLPHGQGTFSSQNPEGTGWVYEGGWDMGHMQGEGMTIFDTGHSEAGWYENDYLNGQGSLYQDDRPIYEGGFAANIPEGQGTLYSFCGEIIYSGQFTEGFIDETNEARHERVAQFKSNCETPDYDAMMESADNADGLRAQISGTVVYVYEMDEAGYDSSFIVELTGGDMVCVDYHLSVGETPVAMGKDVTVWGMADYLYTYPTDIYADGTNPSRQVSIPLIEAWNVADVSGTQL